MGIPIKRTINSPTPQYSHVIQNGKSNTMFNSIAIINIVAVNKNELMIKRAHIFFTNLQIKISKPSVIIE